MDNNELNTKVQAELDALNESIRKINLLHSQLYAHAEKLRWFYRDYLKTSEELKETDEFLEEITSYMSLGVKIDKMNMVVEIEDAVGKENKHRLKKILKKAEKHYTKQEDVLKAIEELKRIKFIEYRVSKDEKYKTLGAYQNNFIMHLKKLEAEVNNGYRTRVRNLVRLGARNGLKPLSPEEIAVYAGEYNYVVSREPVLNYVCILGGVLKEIEQETKKEAEEK